MTDRSRLSREELEQFLVDVRKELTPDELFILDAMHSGQSTSDIALEIGYSQLRVERLKRQLRHRLQGLAKNTIELQGERLSPTSLSVYLDPGDAPEELLTEFFIALASVYRASGGSGLTIVRDERRAIVGEVL